MYGEEMNTCLVFLSNLVKTFPEISGDINLRVETFNAFLGYVN